MKKILILCVAVLTGLLAFSACKKVHLDEFVAVTGVKLDQENISLVIGDEFTLHATVTPSNATKKTVKWTSNTNSVASVDVDGKVSAWKEGTANITATTESGNFTATCKVTVLKERVAVTGVSIEPSSTTLKVGGETRLSAKLAPENATNHIVTWISDRTDIATVDDGLVTGKAMGTAHITVKTADGGKEATATVKVVQPFTKINILSPDTSGIHYDASSEKFIFFTEDVFEIVAGGEPETAEDSFTFEVSGWSNNNYKNYFDIEQISDNTCRVVTANKTYSDLKVRVSSKADPSVSTIFVFNTVVKPSGITLYPIPSECGVCVSSATPRNTSCIGAGATQKFRVSVTDGNGASTGVPQDVILVNYNSDDSVHPSKASLSGNTLTVTVPANAAASTLSRAYWTEITIQAKNGYQQEFTFLTTQYDPYEVKPGDGFSKNASIYDGGYRGNGLFDPNLISTPYYVNSIIVYLGDEHTTEDPLWNSYKPSIGVKDATGKVLHGIAIPVNTDYLTRSSETGGVFYYTDGGNDNFILDSGNLPSWVKTTERKNLLKSTSLKHSAFMNTCCHVYTNAGRGPSYEILPFNFFVEDATKAPSQSESNSMASDNYVFCGTFASSSSGFTSTAAYESGITGKYMTPWLLPTIADITSIFCGRVINRDGADTQDFQIDGVGTPELNERFAMIGLCSTWLSRKDEGIWTHSSNWKWWLANETGQNKFCQAIVSKSGSNVSMSINKNVPHKDSSKKAYVLPIRYF